MGANSDFLAEAACDWHERYPEEFARLLPVRWDADR